MSDGSSTVGADSTRKLADQSEASSTMKSSVDTLILNHGAVTLSLLAEELLINGMDIHKSLDGNR